MPKLGIHKWNGFIIKARPPERDFFRTLDIFHLLPDFWDKEISLDLLIQPPKNQLKMEETWEYRWELCNPVDKILKENRGIIKLNPKEIKKKYWACAERAISIGFLKPYKQYNVKVYLTSGEYGKSEALKVATYTVKDREEYNIQLLILIIGISFVFLLWLSSGGV